MGRGAYYGINMTTLTNAVANGDFSNGMTGWTDQTAGGTSRVQDGYLYFPAWATQKTYHHTACNAYIPLIKGRIYYVRAMAWKIGGGMSRWGLYNQKLQKTFYLPVLSEDSTKFELQSFCYTATEDGETKILLYGNGSTWSATQEVKWDDVMFIDLTEAFGAGKEPTKEWCDANLSFFNGTKAIIVNDEEKDGLAGKVKAMWFGVGERRYKNKTVEVNEDSVAGLFKEYRGSYSFSAESGVYSPDNIGEINATATLKLEALQEIKKITLNWKVNTEEPYDVFTISVNGSTRVTATGKQEGTWNGSLKKGDALTFAYAKDIYGDAEGEYVSVQDIYCTITDYDNYDILPIARKVRKGFVSHDGVAKIFFGKRDLVYKGSAGSVHATGRGLSSANNKAVAVFAGGYRDWASTSETAEAYAFDRNITRHNADNLSQAGYEMAGASAGRGKYALFGGGYERGSYVDGYDEHLTLVVPERLDNAVTKMCGVEFGGLAVFAGGSRSSTNSNSVVYYYDEDLTRGTAPDRLSLACDRMGAAAVEDKILIGGGVFNNTEYDTITVYDDEWTRLDDLSLSVARHSVCGCSVDGFAMFFGGVDSTNTGSKVVDVFNADLTRYIAETSFTGNYTEAEEIDGMAVFTDGVNTEVWDDTLTAELSATSEIYRGDAFALSVVGDYVLIGGGITADAGASADSSAECVREVAAFKLR